MLSARLVARAAIVGALATLATTTAAQGPADEVVMLDFWSESCGPCRSMEGTVAQLMSAGYPIRKININQNRDLARQFQVTSIPAFVLVRGGQEIARLEGAVSSAELLALFAQARTSAQGATRQPPAGSPAASSSSRTPAGAPASGAANWFPAGSANPRAGSANLRDAGPANSREAGLVAASGGFPTGACLAATVRLTVEDATGISCGSGTLVDARSGEALILTCAHIFRESQGKGKITVDVFGANPQSKLSGQVIAYDLKRDVGLVSIRPRGPVATARVAPPGHALRVGDRVASVGCDGGADPTVRESRVTAINRFLGPANVEVAGQPVQGRSGGGLFSSEGYVIGVCNAADPSDDEGIYMASATIQAQLDQSGLAALYRRASEPASALASAPSAATRAPNPSPRATSGATSGAGPAMPATMPARMPASPLAVKTPRAAEGAAAGSGADVQPLTPQERATLGAIAQKSQNAEVICIVRPLNDPQAKCEIIVLDRASPAFLRQLSAESATQASRHLTSLEIARYAGAAGRSAGAAPAAAAGFGAPQPPTASGSGPGAPPAQNAWLGGR